MTTPLGRNTIEELAYILYGAKEKYGNSEVLNYIQEEILSLCERVNPNSNMERSKFTIETGLVTRTLKVGGRYIKGQAINVPFLERNEYS